MIATGAKNMAAVGMTARLFGVVLAAGIGSAPARGQDMADLRQLDIETLGTIEVTSASRRPEPLSDVAAAISVITDEEIRGGAAATVPDILRYAPNLHVQRIDARQYSVNARGFSGYETSNKLLVLVDGRSLYSPLFSGVFWDRVQLPHDAIDQIEVINGPGGTLWGPNAVNGVISIRTKSAFDMQGVRLRAEGGADEQQGALHYGGLIGEATAMRVELGGFNRRGMPASEGRDLADGGAGVRFGARIDGDAGAGQWMMSGSIQNIHGDDGGRDHTHHLLARWTGTGIAGGRLVVQAYRDRYRRKLPGLTSALTTNDLSFQHDVAAGDVHIVWGGGVRTTLDRFDNRLNGFVLVPQRKRLWGGNLFGQGEWAATSRLTLTAGVKLEQTSFTGLLALPSVRMAYALGQGTLLWGAVSRAVRTPSRIDRELVFPGVLEPGSFRAEKLTAFELGLRTQPNRLFSASVSAFFNLYDDLRTTAYTPGPIVPVRLANGMHGHNYGVDAWAMWRPTAQFRLRAGLSWLDGRFRLDPGAVDLEDGISLGNNPHWQGSVRAELLLPENIRVDATLRAVDTLPDPRVPAYVDADLRLGWRARKDVELYLAGTNLLNASREESADADRGQRIARSVRAGIAFAW